MEHNRRTFLTGAAALGATALGATAISLGSVPAWAAGSNLPGARRLVMVFLAGGNDGLSMVSPYADPAYRLRRPTIALSGSQVLQVGTDSQGTALGLHPALTGLKRIFDQGHLAILPRVGYPSASRSHFVGTDIISTALPQSPSTVGWLGRYLDSIRSPLDPLYGWNTEFQQPRSFLAEETFVASITNPSAYTYLNPWSGLDVAVQLARTRPSGEGSVDALNSIAATAIETIPRVEQVLPYQPTVAYPQTKLGRSLQLVSSAIARGVGSKVFWVQAEGYDTHSRQGTVGGTFERLMGILDAGLTALHADLLNQGLLDDTLVLVLSEFGRRIDENGSEGTDHGAAGAMLAIGGKVRAGIQGTASRSLAVTPDNPDLENEGRDLAFSTDFRSVYASVLRNWLDVAPDPILRGAFLDPRLAFLST